MAYLNLKVFDYSKRQMDWVTQRQKILANNIANSDTPGYTAKDAVPLTFKEALKGRHSPPLGMRKPEHDTTLRKGLVSGHGGTLPLRHPEGKLSGNNVIIEDQLKMVNETSLLQQQVLTVYKEYATQLADILQV